MKDLGSRCYFFGIEVARSDKGIFLSQQNTSLISLRRLVSYKARTPPIEINHKLKSGNGDQVDKEMYLRLVGRLAYLSYTHANITYAMSVVSQFMPDPRSSHLEAAYRILRYLKSAPGKGILSSSHGHLKL